MILALFSKESRDSNLVVVFFGKRDSDQIEEQAKLSSQPDFNENERAQPHPRNVALRLAYSKGTLPLPKR